MEEILLQTSVAGAVASECKLFTFGAHITSWKTFSALAYPDGLEHLWMSSLSSLDGSGPIRGGIPIAFPQFADTGTMPLHGFAREKIWSVLSRTSEKGSDCLVMKLSSDEDTKSRWGYNFDFELTLTIELQPSSLSMNMAVQNLSTRAMPFTGCFHTYFRTADIRACEVSGLESLKFIDKVDKYSTKQGSGLPLSISSDAAAHPDVGSEYYIDRIYLLPSDEPDRCRLVLTDRGLHARAVVVEKSTTWTHWVVFNPWEAGKRGSRGPDFDDDGYNYMVCLEPTVASEPVVIAPNCCWEGSQKISVAMLA